MLSRRKFLQTSSIVSLSPFLPRFLGSTAQAANAASEERVLVVIQLGGGNDGINTVVPFGDDAYGQARNKLRLETDKIHKLDDHLGLHPWMDDAKKLFDEGHLKIIQGVGYPNPDRSHFRSMKIWQTASFDDADHNSYGWLGKTLDLQRPQASGATTANAIYVGEQETPVALWGRRSTATALSQAEDLHLQSGMSSESLSFATAPEKTALQQFVTKQMMTAYAAADEFERQQLSNNSDTQDYPNTELASRLRLVSQMIRSGSQTRVFYTAQDGYDTHSAQLYTHARLLREFSDALKAFLNDLKAAKLDDRVVVLAFSEFGRRVKENDSQGTDHGTAGPVFVAGGKVSGGLLGNPPDLTDLDSGDLKMQTDFRRVYASILDQWLGVNSESILGDSFKSLELFSS